MAALILFGGGGDLAMRMLLPSLYFLDHDGLLPEGLKIIGAARSEESAEEYVAKVHEAVKARAEADGGWSDATWARMKARLDYLAVDATDPASLAPLKAKCGDGEVTSFLAVSPSLYGRIVTAMKAAGLAEKNCRIVLEKPVGRDLESFLEIDDAVAHAFDERQVFRIDHYLGKETVQNLIALRFGNAIFEPLWNNLTIDHVQITVGETVGVGDRWPYYDEYGALRDMVQNHMLQLLCLVAMEPPSDMEPDSVRNEKVKVLRSLRPVTRADVQTVSVRGQYTPGVVAGKAADGYEAERGQPTGTETFVALRADIDNWRWAGVPFYLRTGKRLPERRTQIAIQFKPVPHSIFEGAAKADLAANRLVIDLQPDEDIELLLMNKAPGLSERGMRLQSLPLSLALAKAYSGPNSRRRIAYERLILDVIQNNSTLFVRRDEVEAQWNWIDGIRASWTDQGLTPRPYTAGSWGPSAAIALAERGGVTWHE